MDNLHGNFNSPSGEDEQQDDLIEEEGVMETPPPAIGTDERRMQVRAYNHWASQLGQRNFPSIEELNPENSTDFGPYSVLLDFTSGIEDPSIQFLGECLAEECGTDRQIQKLTDIPARSLLTRITDHYMQILANQAPIGFEAEFVNQRDATILYRGILLPYSSDGETIDFIYGVINWKELADQKTADELLLEIGQALNDMPEEEEDHKIRSVSAGAEWADGPGAEIYDLGTQASDLEMPNSLQPGGSAADPAQLAPLPGDDLLAEQEGCEEACKELTIEDLIDLDASIEDWEETDEGIPEELVEEIEQPCPESISRLSSLIRPKGREHAGDNAEGQLSGRNQDEDLYDEMGEGLGLNFGPVLNEAGGAVLVGKSSADDSEQGADDQSAPEEISDKADGADEDAEPQAEAGDADADSSDDAGPEDQPAAAEQTAEEDQPAKEDQADASGKLYKALAYARASAEIAREAEDRSHAALYAAISWAHDFALACEQSPDEFAAILADNNLQQHSRAPMTPLVKLVFGVNYDKTRLAEYAAVLTYAERKKIAEGALEGHLAEVKGGIKGIVAIERRRRQKALGKTIKPPKAVRRALAGKLRKLETRPVSAIEESGKEFGLVMIRRLESGEIAIIGEISDDVTLVEKAGRKLLS